MNPLAAAVDTIPPQSILNKEKSTNIAVDETAVSPTQPLPLKFSSSSVASSTSSLQNQSIRDCFHDLLNKQAFQDLIQCLAEDVQYVVNRSFSGQSKSVKKKGLDQVKNSLMEDCANFFPKFNNEEGFVVLKQASEGNCIFTEYGRIENETAKFVEMLELDVSTDKISRIEMINLGDNVDLSVTPPTESDGDITKLQASIMGRVVTPKSADYQEQVAMAMKGIDTAPAVMIQCLGTNDVIQAIRFCQDFERKSPDNNVPRTAVRGGGHSFSGTSTNVGGCVIDLRKMRSIVVDPKTKTAWVDGGATVGDLDREAFVYGLVMPTGQVSHTGIGGLASCGGGYGLLTHRFGVMTDSLLALEMVLADGTVTQYSKEDVDREVFDMCREGSRWLGVVTRFKFQLYELPSKQTCNTVMLWDVKHFKKCFQAYRTLPSKDAIAMLAIVSPPPELLPPNTETKTVVFMHMIVFGDETKAKAVETSLVQDIGESPLVVALPLAPRPWPEVNSSIDFILPFGIPTYAKGFEIEDDNPEKEDKALKFIEKLVQERPLTVAVDFNWTMGEYVRKGGGPATSSNQQQPRKPVFYCAMLNFLDPTNLAGTKQVAKEFAAKFLKECEELKLINNSSRYFNFTETYQSTPFTSEHISNDIHQRFMKVKQRLDPNGFFGKSGI